MTILQEQKKIEEKITEETIQLEKEQQCTGCGVELQTETPDGIGYIPKNKLYKHQKKLIELREFQEREMKDAQGVSKEDKDLVEYLKQ